MTDFLSNPVWAGISGLIAVIALVLTLESVRNSLDGLLQRTIFASDKVARSLHIAYWAIVAVTTLFVGYSYSPLHGAIVVVLAILAAVSLTYAVMHSQHAQLQGKLADVSVSLRTREREIRHIVEVHQATFTLDQHHIDHFIHEDGTGVTVDSQIIRPEADLVYFRKLRFGIMEPAKASGTTPNVQVEAINAISGNRLTVVSLYQSKSVYECAILLDVPARFERPFHLKVTVTRPNLWESLVKEGTDTAEFAERCDVQDFRIRFFLPDSFTLNEFSTVPDPTLLGGSYAVTQDLGRTFGYCTVTDLEPTKFNFRLNASRQEHR